MAENGDRDNFVLLNLDDRNKAQIFPANIYTVNLSLIHISEPTRLLSNSYAVFCLKKKTTYTNHKTRFSIEY